MTCEEYARMKKNKRAMERYYANHEENKAKSREASRRYRERNPELVKARRKAYYLKNREEISRKNKIRQREYYLKNRDRILEKRRQANAGKRDAAKGGTNTNGNMHEREGKG